MPLRIRRVGRLNLPWLGFAILGVWGALVAGVHFATRHSPDAPPLCLLKRTTGIPCPTCGGTRAAFSLAAFRPLEALAFNPLVTFTLLLTAAFLAIRTASGRSVAMEWTRRSRALAWAIFVVAMAANWAWVIHRAAA